ncbi:Hsp33 family molecular chaperone HslO [Gilliamella sp. B3791]|uniref:Hsp33 family molecular chaperone HslO n=1 Tax=unclassified Gilliamella TaxID=2685620 RepID=UPI00226A7C13|nr:Hsp33 family molecular chaperone HslO [Gilliamella sp. B3835]MCX8708544.1 Hsp33 family molecular chaperone HslO [Gilliamella sp. B3783]MCX8709618.1 Hsp33 family molecular chaperone HslO [Gilliamella sp. B3780]MCX8717761.1 Hsp33 family molecular chaperone HslO [Gilliamella sp. B3784]MCX8720097.1 Hsp33 family molecular chaperone HslO [Gilliamella sp. B3788]MCX8739993.1 Hsp33 family molecular chaperone HslO [Gilliamella sp. B2824]MCX8742383.1 Hsp33 family molecular chaperone HslO [Gilliamella
MTNMDTLNRFLFDNHAIRGEITHLEQTYQAILDNHTYPVAVQKVLGELLVITSLLTATLKFEGDIAVQLQGDGPLSLAVVNGNDQQQLRGVARVKSDIANNATLKEMVGNGYIVITITPKNGERYQGIVGLESDTLIGCIENYFMQSEQLPTRLFVKTGVYNNKPVAAGILLQILPGNENTSDSFEHLCTLTQTITSDELFELSTEEILYRLYNQEQVRLFDTHNVTFKCGCSRERCEDSLMTLPANEIDQMLKEDGGKIDIHCDYCGKHYIFDTIDIAQIRAKQHTNYH